LFSNLNIFFNFYKLINFTNINFEFIKISNACGGGEKVLFCMIKSLEKLKINIIIYSGNLYNYIKEKKIKKTSFKKLKIGLTF